MGVARGAQWPLQAYIKHRCRQMRSTAHEDQRMGGNLGVA